MAGNESQRAEAVLGAPIRIKGATREPSRLKDSLPTKKEWREGRDEGLLSKTTSSPQPSPPSGEERESNERSTHEAVFKTRDYDLATTLNSGESFRWNPHGTGWAGVVHGRWVRLEERSGEISARTAAPQNDWLWLADYLQVEVNIEEVFATFPDDATLQRAVRECRGLRLLKLDPWECLASFILSSTKQIVQIRQIVALLCERYGTRLTTPAGEPPAFDFPTAQRLASLTEADLRACKMGFRAPYLLATARRVAGGDCNLERLRSLSIDEARSELVELPGVGEKIANCVLLYAHGFPTAFPLDVWVIRALRQFYFRGRRAHVKRLREFSRKHFGPHSGYAQQYLFHWIRTRREKEPSQ